MFIQIYRYQIVRKW